MKEKKIKIIITVMLFSVLGLLVIQYYWLRHLIKVESEIFEVNVSEALQSTVEQLEEKETALIVINEIDKNNASTKKMFFVQPKTKKHTDSIKSEINMFFWEDSNRVTLNTNIKKMRKTGRNSIIAVSDSIEATCYNSNEQENLKSKKRILIEKVVDKLSKIQEGIPVKKRLDSNFVNKVLWEEFNKKGIKAEFVFSFKDVKKDSLFSMKWDDDKVISNSNSYEIKLFPEEFSFNDSFLIVQFPDKSIYILKSVSMMLGISILLIFLIVYLFYKTIRMLLMQKKITELKNELINNITHEFKTPISTI